ncbi:hypothetical protein HYH02_002352 [Chlamydomonas schloesseri]|uniref:Heterokaryon incompatibility domain-containing protein n=1 Tax=Chlamydomonas schloesseri TaxID=2026947 RepID=A0A835WUL3_9CHLO|nr:hypothetical protein HYH02_002352 [Chlamydomonas schloesseri]|eukprot:KAG2453016.1 hypothetical protein HYH02_002352 [Chlamydomonas schloesseri]
MGCGASTAQPARLSPEDQAKLQEQLEKQAALAKQLEEDRKQWEAERKRLEEERTKLENERRLQEEAAAAKKKAEEEAAAAVRRAEEEAAAKIRAEQEAARKKAEAEAAAKKRAEEEAAAKKKAEEEAAAKKKAEEEAAAAAAEAERLRWEAEAKDATSGDPALAMDFPSANLHLAELQEFVLELQDQLPLPVRAAPMRLLHIDAVLRWDGGIRVFEEVKPEEAITVPYTDVTEEQWADTAVLSWRWGNPKPSAYVEGFSPMSGLQLAEMRRLLHRLRAAGFKLVWIDWSCVPQYRESPMTEVLRSKLFYARARTMVVLPVFMTFEGLPENSAGVVRVLLGKAARALKRRAKEEGRPNSAEAGAALSRILESEVVAGREYFCRAWTLAERMARHGRSEPLRQWLSCETWLGMLVDSLIHANEDRSTSKIYQKILGPEAATLLDALVEPLGEAVATGSPHDENMVEQVATLFEAAAGVWKDSLNLAEAPSKSWLAAYLNEVHTGIYQAWSRPDLLWAVYSYFCFKPLDQGTDEGVMAALQALVKVVGGDEMRTSFLATKMGLGHMITLRPLDRRLHTAVADNKAAEVKELLAAGAFVEALDAAGRTPLLMAVVAGHADTVRVLLDGGASRQACMSEEEKDSALHVAAARGDARVAELLVEGGADTAARDAAGCTPLTVAAREGHLEVVQLLLRASGGKDVETKDYAGNTPLHHAAIHDEVAAALTAAGASKAARNAAGQTPADRLKALETRRAAGIPPRPPTSDAERVLLEECSKPQTESRAVAAAVKKLLLTDATVNANAQNEGGETPLHLTARNGHKDAFRVLTLCGALRNVRTKADNTPLHCAAVGGHVGIVELLLAEAVDMEAVNKAGDTPLLLAALEGKVDCVRLLLKSLAAKDVVNKDGMTALHCAALSGSAETIRLLLSAGLDMEARTKTSSSTPLHLAAGAEASEAVVRALVGAQADLRARDEDDYTPLQVAVRSGNVEALRALLEAAPPELQRERTKKGGHTLLHLAGAADSPNTLEELVTAGFGLEDMNELGDTPLGHAAAMGKTEAVNKLVKLGAQKEAKRKAGGYTPLHLSAYSNHKDTVAALLRLGADKESMSEAGQTPLLLAATGGAVEAIKVLIEAGANKEAMKPADGGTPLTCAVLAGKAEAVRALCAAKVNVQVQTKEGKGLLHVAAGVTANTAEIIECLVAAGCKLDSRDKEGDTPLHIAARSNPAAVTKLLKLGASITQTTKSGLQPIHVAAQEGCEGTVLALLSGGAHIDTPCPASNGVTPLHITVIQGHVALMNLLVAKGANKHAVIEGGNTAMHLAVANDDPDIIRALHKAGAYMPNKRNDDGLAPVHVAAQEGAAKAIPALHEIGEDMGLLTGKNEAIHLAVHEDNAEVMKALFKVRPECKERADGNGFTPHILAIRLGKVEAVRAICMDFLYFYFTSQLNTLKLALLGSTPAVVEMCMEIYPYDKTLKDSALHFLFENGLNLLHVAAQRKIEDNGAMVTWLVEKKGLGNLLFKVAEEHLSYASPKFLPLHFAAKCGNASTVRALVRLARERGVNNINQSSNYEGTPLDLAIKYKNEEAKAALKALGAR